MFQGEKHVFKDGEHMFTHEKHKFLDLEHKM